MPLFNNYERLKNLAKILIYIQIACSLIGFIDVLYIRVSLIHLGVELFALSAIISNNQSLSRTYVVLLFCAVLLDISWFVFISHHRTSSEATVSLFIILVRLTLVTVIVGFCVRLFSSLVWIRMCILGGVSLVDSDGDAASSEDPNAINPDDLRNQFISQAVIHVDADALEDNNYIPPYTNSFEEDPQQDDENSPLDHNDGVGRSRSCAEIPMSSPVAVRRSFSFQ